MVVVKRSSVTLSHPGRQVHHGVGRLPRETHQGQRQTSLCCCLTPATVSSYAGGTCSDTCFLTQAKPLFRFLVDHSLVQISTVRFGLHLPVVVSRKTLNKYLFDVSQTSMSSLLLGSLSELIDPTALASLGFESLSSISLVFPPLLCSRWGLVLASKVQILFYV